MVIALDVAQVSAPLFFAIAKADCNDLAQAVQPLAG